MKKLFFAAAVLLSVSCSAYAAGDVNVTVNGTVLDCDTVLKEGTTYIPLRAVSEALGAEVSWDGETRTASINMSDDAAVQNIINDVSESVVAIVGNYKPEYISDAALSYNEGYGFGSGMVIKSSGIILTNAHVVNELSNLTVIFNDGTSYAGTAVYTDTNADLAIVKINKLGLKPVTFAEADDIQPGKTVIAIGTPLKLSRLNTVTKGIISAVGVEVGDEYFRYTQSDVATNGGNSGGPLIDMNGNVIGVNTAKTAGIGIEGTSYSIPVDTIKYVIERYENNIPAEYPDLKMSLSESWEARLGLPTEKGLTVTAAENGILTSGDVLNKVNGISVHSIVDIHEALKSAWDGGTVIFTYTHDGNNAEAQYIP